mmetsp:Transcript_13912/g.29698  ORF Transcript_13912/g.29698 Transcript_13912/m.29698 type:complete len:690 (-) Transcript_13912:273-2342(-)
MMLLNVKQRVKPKKKLSSHFRLVSMHMERGSILSVTFQLLSKNNSISMISKIKITFIPSISNACNRKKMTVAVVESSTQPIVSLWMKVKSLFLSKHIVYNLAKPLFEKVISLIIHNNKCWKVLHVNLPYCLHPVLFVIQNFHVFNTVLCQDCCGATNAAQVKSTILFAGICHLTRSIALGKSYERSSILHEFIDIGIHSPGGGGTERTRSIALRGFGRAGIVYDIVFGIVRQPFSRFDLFEHFCMRNVSCDDDGSREAETRAHRILRQCFAQLVHGHGVQIHLQHRIGRTGLGAIQVFLRHLRQILAHVRLQLFEEDTLLGDLSLDLPIGAAGYADPHGTTGPVPRQANDADVVTKVLAPELRPDAKVPRHVQNVIFPFDVPEGAAGRVRISFRRQGIVILRRGQLDRLEVLFRAKTSDNDRQVVRRTGRRADRFDVRLQEGFHATRVQKSLRLLIEKRFVGRPAALGDEQKVILVALRPEDVHLRRKIVPRILLVEHGQGSDLAVPQVQLGVGIVRAAGEMLVVVSVGQDPMAPLSHDDGRSRVLASGQYPPRCDVGIFEQFHGHESIVVGGFRIFQYVAKLGEVGGAEEVGDVAECGGGERAERLAGYAEHGCSVRQGDRFDCRCREDSSVFRRGVRGEVEEGCVGKFRRGRLYLLLNGRCCRFRDFHLARKPPMLCIGGFDGVGMV